MGFHLSHKRIATVTGVRPTSRFGELVASGNRVINFSEKPQIGEGYVNGGFFVFNRKVFNYLKEDENCVFEKEPLEKLALDGELMAFFHNDFWRCMDTFQYGFYAPDRRVLFSVLQYSAFLQQI